FTSTLHRGELVWIYFTNLLAIVCSLGLALPWALTRTHAYKVSRLTVHIDDPALLTRVRDTAQSLGAAAGDAAVDLMDIDVGLA
ncbi:MAG: DUF898 domain-containing protein, partial [Deltaproteobacteria bacterium]|nr:DUF898 domain-containing protein [Deltaproteobacteria bacterium]